MNDQHSPDDLAARLDAVGDALERAPRPDDRLDALLGATPPVAGSPDAVPAAIPVLPLAAPTSTRRIAWVAVAAVLALVAGLGLAFVAVADDDPAPSAASTGDGDQDEAPADADADAPGDADADPDLGDTSLEEGLGWLECLADQFESMFDGGFPGHDGERPGLSAFEECGEPPLPEGDGWFSFGEIPDLGEWPGLEMLPDLGELPSVQELCSSESRETGLDIACAWPACDDETDCPFPPDCADATDGAPSSCFSFDFGFELDLDADGFAFSLPFGDDGQFFLEPEGLPGLEGLLDLEGLLELAPDLDTWFDHSGPTDA